MTEPLVRGTAYESMGIRREPALLDLLLARLVEEDHRIGLSSLHFALAWRGARGSVLVLGDMMLDPEDHRAQIRSAYLLMELCKRVPKSMRSWVVGRATAARKRAVRSVRGAMDELLECYGARAT